MTAESFRRKIRKRYKIDDITNYIIAVAIIGVGIYFVAKTIYFGLPGKSLHERLLTSCVFLIPITMGLYVFWRIPKDYIVLRIDTKAPIKEKVDAIESYMADLQTVTKYVDGNHRYYCYRDQFFRTVDIRFYVDEVKVLYNVQSSNIGLKGVLDFGLTKRASKRLSTFLNACL